MGIVFKNNAKTTLASNLSNSATSATVTDGSVFPSLSAGEFFLLTFDDGSNNEICKCTARSGNTLTIVRAQESTTARAFSSGDAAEGRVTAGVLEQIQENIAAKSANQTVFNATTAGGATTYNIGTNPGVEANAMVFLNGVLQHHDTISFSGTNLTFDAAPPNGMALEVIVDNLINLQSSNLTVDTFTAADVSGNPQTDFTLSDTPAAETNLIVFVDGVFQDQDAYTISSNTLTITTGVIAGRGVTVYVINPVNIGTPSDSTVTSDKLSGNITMPGSLTVGSHDVAFDSPTFFVDHTNSRVGLGTSSPSVPVDIVGDVKMSANLTVDTSTLVVDSTNNRVGIGTDNPASKLTLSDTSSNSIVQTRFINDARNFALGVHGGLSDSFVLYDETAGATRVIVDTSGNVLIGATSPNFGAFSNSTSPQLLVAGSMPQVALHETDTDKDGYIGIAGSTMFIQTADDIPIRFGQNDVEVMRIDTDGRLAINNATTAADSDINDGVKLVVAGGTVVGSAAGADNAFLQYTDAGGLTVLQGSGTYALRVFDDNSSVPRFNVMRSGNVGIGNNAPNSMHANANKLVVGDGGGDTGMSVFAGTNVGRYAFARAVGDNTDAYDGGMTYDGNRNLTFHTNAGSERARIDGSGRFAIGVTNPADYYATNLVVQGASEGGITLASTSTSVANYIMFADGTSGDARYRGYIGYNHSSDQMAFASAGTERAFIDSGGRFTFGGNFAHSTYAHTAVFGANSVPLGTVVIEDFDVSSGIGNTVLNLFLRDQDPATNAIFIDFRDGGGRVGSVTHNDDGGGVSYNTTSDYRLKENVNYDWEALSLLNQLKPAKFNFKRNPEKTIQGMLAHEVMDIVPSSVIGKKDHLEPIGNVEDADGNTIHEGVYEHFCKTDEGQTWTQTGEEPFYQQLDYSRLVPLLTKAIQELEAKIETLEAEVKELKGE